MKPITKQQAVFYFCEGCQNSEFISPPEYSDDDEINTDCSIKNEGKICDMLKNFLSSQIQQGNIQPPEYRWKLKSEEEIEKILKKSGYDADSKGNYYHEIFPPFLISMKDGCGKYISNNTESYHPDWVEKEEII